MPGNSRTWWINSPHARRRVKGRGPSLAVSSRHKIWIIPDICIRQTSRRRVATQVRPSLTGNFFPRGSGNYRIVWRLESSILGRNGTSNRWASISATSSSSLNKFPSRRASSLLNYRWNTCVKIGMSTNYTEILPYPKYQFSNWMSVRWMTQIIRPPSGGHGATPLSRNFSTFIAVYSFARARARVSGCLLIDQDRFVGGRSLRVDINHFNRAIVRAARTSE